MLIVESTLLVASLLAGAPTITVLGCPDCHHDALHLVTDAARTAMAVTGRHGSTLVADAPDPRCRLRPHRTARHHERGGPSCRTQPGPPRGGANHHRPPAAARRAPHRRRPPLRRAPP
ncbi:MAG: hypothetical protein U5R31_08615 [Acidimicrobiia bacterium]|nr:hypothetical protein [Acidimicrobiia bacterium]